MTDLLLIETPHGLASEEKVDVPPLGLAYIAAVAEKEGFSIEILDLNLGEDNIESRIKRAGTVGISCYTHNYPYALELLSTAKEHGKTVVIGGPHATPLYKDALSDGFDYVVRGEGEFPTLNLLKGSGDVRGLAFMQGGVPRANLVFRVKDLDSLPLPARHLLDIKRYSFPGALPTTRGCAHHCIFCSSRNQSGCLRARSVASLRSELEDLLSRGIESFFGTDPNFAFDRKRTLEFCCMVKDPGMEWFTELRLDHVDGEIIKEMSRSGCRVVRFGIESGSQRVVDFIKKGISIKNLEDVIRTFRHHRIVPVCGFMIGHPTETKKDFEMTLRLAKKVIALGGESTFAIQTPYPGTYLYNNAEKLGIKILTRDWREYHHLNPVVETENFSADDLREMLFDALLEISGTKLPEANIEDGDAPKMRRLMDGIERRSFRSICMEVS
ncbi:MAG: B12-binding domain-containing radical SAM protein [Candidatus Hydrothermarchaeales archaeon]